jgi:ethanolamine utilization protein EutQ (cupin superfamily)
VKRRGGQREEHRGERHRHAQLADGAAQLTGDGREERERHDERQRERAAGAHRSQRGERERPRGCDDDDERGEAQRVHTATLAQTWRKRVKRVLSSGPAAGSLPGVKRLITEQDVVAAHAAGKRAIACVDAIVTPSAWMRARELGVVIGESARGGDVEPAKRHRVPDPGESKRDVDASGITVVRGRSVRLGEFAAAPGVALTDLITSKDGAPMAAGVMSWSRDDSFAWHLTYDEIDYVLEGVLAIEIGGRVVEARPGDVVYIPKGSRIVFGTPSRVKLFYVTYPADWDAPRPQK